MALVDRICHFPHVCFSEMFLCIGIIHGGHCTLPLPDTPLLPRPLPVLQTAGRCSGRKCFLRPEPCLLGLLMASVFIVPSRAFESFTQDTQVTLHAG